MLQVRTSDAEDPLNAEERRPSVVDEQQIGQEIWALMRYHVVMLLASMYMTMILCSWEVDSPANATLESFGVNTWSMVVKLVSQWAAVILYFWTLVAPKVLTGRKFEFGPM